MVGIRRVQAYALPFLPNCFLPSILSIHGWNSIACSARFSQLLFTLNTRPVRKILFLILILILISISISININIVVELVVY